MPLLGRLKTILLGALFLLGMALPGSAQAQGFYYSVQRGDTVAGVAQRFGLSESQLLTANRLQPGAQLGAGTKLWIPRRGPAPAPATSRPSVTPAPQRRPAPAASTPSQRAKVFAPSAPVSAPPSAKTPTPRSQPVIAPAPSQEAYTGIHVVRRGESLWKIANENGLSVQELAQLNGISPEANLVEGQRLIVTPTGERPEVREVPGGGLEMSRPTVARSSSTAAPSVPAASTSSSASASGAAIRPSRAGFIWPVEGRIIRRFAARADEKYTGIDIAVPRGTEVRAAADGKVIYASDSIPFYGLMVIVDHGNSLSSCYGQNSRILVREGQVVRRGQVIARSGDSGRRAEPYLHFEIRKGGDAVNPEPYLP